MIISTEAKRQIIDITDKVEKQIEGSGIVSASMKHTTAALTAADLDPGTDLDMLDALKALTPNINWRHPHDPSHFPDHLWASLIGPSVIVPFKDGKLQLGSWQRVVLIELDGPRDRQIELTSYSHSK